MMKCWQRGPLLTLFYAMAERPPALYKAGTFRPEDNLSGQGRLFELIPRVISKVISGQSQLVGKGLPIHV